MNKVNGRSGTSASKPSPASGQGRIVFAPYGPGTEQTPYAVLQAESNGNNAVLATTASRELAARIANGL